MANPKPLLSIALIIAGAHTAAAQEPVLEEVLVTAQKRAQSAQEIPLTINVVDGDILQNFAISTTNDLADSVPGLTVQATPQNLSNITIRGLGTGAGSESFDQSVGLFVDGIYAGRLREFSTSLFDVERIEVIKGTQNSLLGKNTSLGAISVVTRRPGEEIAGYIQTDYEFEYDSLYGTGAIDLPTEFGNYRVAVNWVDEGGYVDNGFTGNEGPEREQTTVRVTALYDVGEDGELTLSYQYDDLSIDGDTFQPVKDDLGVIASIDPLVDLDADKDKRAWTAQSGSGDADDEQDSHRAMINYEQRFGEFTFTSLSGYSEYDNRRVVDSDFLIVEYLSTAYDTDFEQFTQEFRLASPASENLEYIAGLFYLNSELNYEGLTDAHFPPTVIPLDGSYVRGYDQDTEVWSAFGQGTYSITSDWRVTLGLRYTDEQKDANWSNTITRIGNPLFPVFIEEVPNTPLDREEDNLDGSINIQYELNDDIMTFASWARGTKSGGFATDGVDSPEDAEYDSEEAETWEVGAKMNLLSGAALLNLSAFYTDIDDFQVVTFVGDGFLTETIAAETQGIEAEAQWAVTADLMLAASATYAEAEEKDSGLTLPQAPQWSASTNANYSTALGESGYILGIQGQLNWRDEQYNQRGEPEADDDLTLLNLRVAITAPNDQWEVAVVGRNLLNDDTSFLFDFPVVTPLVVPPGTTKFGSLNRPRTIALQARYNF